MNFLSHLLVKDISVGMLLVGGNYMGLVLTFVVQELLRQDALGAPPFLPSSLFLIVVSLLSLFAATFFKGEYKRLDADSRGVGMPSRSRV